MAVFNSDTAKDHARGLYMLAAEQHREREYLEELKAVAEVLDENPAYVEILCAPSITSIQREKLIDEAFSNSLSEYTLSFLKLLCRKGYMPLFDKCYDEFRKLYLDFSGTVRAKVISAVELTEAERAKVQEKIHILTGHSAMVRYTVDPSILGGIIIETDDQTIDASVRRRLKEIKEVIKK